MKTLLVLALAINATLATPKSPLYQKWTKFKTHKKVYSNALEELRRLTIFNENVAKIEDHNNRYKNGEVTHTKAINQFGDLTKEEFLEYVNRGKARKPKHDERLRRPYKAPKKSPASAVDWRRNAVTQVKNQGQCGSCWSFSATGALEGQLALRQGRLVPLSEQNLMDCSGWYGNNGCEGGWMDSAFSYIHDNGIMSEIEYPYEAKKDICRYDSGQSVTSVQGYHDLPFGDENALAGAVSSNGPVSVGVDATDELQFYSSGILNDGSCSTSELNHGVLVVGYGTDEQDYWIVKNSWGSRWGDGGYYKAVRNQGNNCGIATAASFPVV